MTLHSRNWSCSFFCLFHSCQSPFIGTILISIEKTNSGPHSLPGLCTGHSFPFGKGLHLCPQGSVTEAKCPPGWLAVFAPRRAAELELARAFELNAWPLWAPFPPLHRRLPFAGVSAFPDAVPAGILVSACSLASWIGSRTDYSAGSAALTKPGCCSSRKQLPAPVGSVALLHERNRALRTISPSLGGKEISIIHPRDVVCEKLERMSQLYT